MHLSALVCIVVIVAPGVRTACHTNPPLAWLPFSRHLQMHSVDLGCDQNPNVQFSHVGSGFGLSVLCMLAVEWYVPAGQSWHVEPSEEPMPRSQPVEYEGVCKAQGKGGASSPQSVPGVSTSCPAASVSSSDFRQAVQQCQQAGGGCHGGEPANWEVSVPKGPATRLEMDDHLEDLATETRHGGCCRARSLHQQILTYC